MKRLVFSTLFVSSTLFGFGGMHGGMHYSMHHSNGNNFDYILQQYPIQSLSSQEKSALLHMRDEEKLARDVYITLYNKWKIRIFDNISRAEQHHMDMVKSLLNRYNLPDNISTIEYKIGIFHDSKVQKLYNKLVKQGSKSQVEALKVGALIEDLDIYDLEKFMQKTDNQDILFVFRNLTKGSRNHMRGFVRFLNSYKATYIPKYISIQEYNNIINSSYERGMIR